MFDKYKNKNGREEEEFIEEELVDEDDVELVDEGFGEELDQFDDSFVGGNPTPDKNVQSREIVRPQERPYSDDNEEVIGEDGILESEREEYEQSKLLHENQYRESQESNIDNTDVGAYYDSLRDSYGHQEYIDDEAYIASLQAVRKLKIIKAVLGGIALIAVIIAGIFVYNHFFKEGKSANPILSDFSPTLTELINAMYTAEDVDGLAKANEFIVSHFADNIKEQNDIRDSNVYAQRYGYFHNKPIAVSIQEVEQMNEKLFIRYTITCDVASPLTRIALVEINEEGKITRFTEYNTY